MSLSVFIEMTLSAILTVWSPGPNNILLLSNASKYGVRGNLRFMIGIWSGSLTLMCLSGLFCSTLGSIIPGIQPVMKYLGAAYILYLAQASSIGSGTREEAYLENGIFPSDDQCQDHHLRTHHVFCVHPAL